MRMKQGSADEYIQRSHPFLTISQMAEELELGVSTVYDICRRLDLSPITPGRQQKDFILTHKHWSRERLAKVMGVGDRVIIDHCKEMGITIPFQLKPVEIRTISDRLRETWR